MEQCCPEWVTLAPSLPHDLRPSPLHSFSKRALKAHDVQSNCWILTMKKRIIDKSFPQRVPSSKGDKQAYLYVWLDMEKQLNKEITNSGAKGFWNWVFNYR